MTLYFDFEQFINWILFCSKWMNCKPVAAVADYDDDELRSIVGCRQRCSCYYSCYCFGCCRVFEAFEANLATTIHSYIELLLLLLLCFETNIWIFLLQICVCFDRAALLVKIVRVVEQRRSQSTRRLRHRIAMKHSKELLFFLKKNSFRYVFVLPCDFRTRWCTRWRRRSWQ